ncbi:MAG TPA: hypothetical protein VGM81_10665 [Burkholderiaceae bacterium]|jgi:uncharacterized protein (TIGR02285 family)
MHALLRPSLAAALLLAACASVAQAPQAGVTVESITWLSAHEPAVDERQRNERLNDMMVAFMRTQWPEVQHHLVQANPRRGMQLLMAGETVCLPTAVRTPEREEQAYFTNSVLSPPPQLIVRRDKLSALPRNAAGEVDLARLLADPTLHGGLIEGRSYGPTLDAMLARKPANQPAPVLYSGGDFGSKLLPMMALGRVDYTIEYELVLNTTDFDRKLTGALQSVPIQGAGDLVVAGVACPRNPWGLAAITEIDKRLGTPAGAAMLRQAQEHLMSLESRQRYAARLDAFFRERAHPSLIR